MRGGRSGVHSGGKEGQKGAYTQQEMLVLMEKRRRRKGNEMLKDEHL